MTNKEFHEILKTIISILEESKTKEEAIEKIEAMMPKR